MSLSIQLFPRAMRPTTAEDYAVSMLRSRLEGLAPHIKRLATHLDDVVNARGDLDVVCRVKVTLARAFEVPPFTVEGHGRHVRDAVGLVGDAIEGEVRRAIEEAGTPRAHRASRAASVSTAKTVTVRHDDEEGREGEGAHEGPRWEGKEGMTASPPRGRHVHMTRRQAQATSARELSTSTRPSRKSTRKSANRSKRDSNLARQTRRTIHSPESRATSH